MCSRSVYGHLRVFEGGSRHDIYPERELGGGDHFDQYGSRTDAEAGI